MVQCPPPFGIANQLHRIIGAVICCDDVGEGGGVMGQTVAFNCPAEREKTEEDSGRSTPADAEEAVAPGDLPPQAVLHGKKERV